MTSINFEDTLKQFFHLIFEIHDNAYGPSVYQQHQWMTRSQKFNNIFTKGWVKNKEKFYGIFMSFFSKERDNIILPILVDDGDEFKINDHWLKNYTDDNTKIAWNTKLKNKGLVIFYDETDVSLAAISIPITEIYNVAIKLSHDKSDKFPLYLTYPPKFLKGLYSIFYSCLPEDVFDFEKEKLLKNISDLNEQIELHSPVTNSSSSNMGNGVNGIQNIVEKLVSASGLSNSVNTNDIGNMIEKNFNDTAISKIGGVIHKVVENVKGEYDKDNSIGSLMTGISRTLQDTDIQNSISQVASFGTTERENLESTIPTSSNMAFEPSMQD